MSGEPTQRWFSKMLRWQPQWHVGQLVVFWVALLIVGVVLLLAIRVWIDLDAWEPALRSDVTPQMADLYQDIGLDPYEEMGLPKLILAWGGLIVLGCSALSIPVILLATTWKWFGRHEAESRAPLNPPSAE